MNRSHFITGGALLLVALLALPSGFGHQQALRIRAPLLQGRPASILSFSLRIGWSGMANRSPPSGPRRRTRASGTFRPFQFTRQLVMCLA